MDPLSALPAFHLMANRQTSKYLRDIYQSSWFILALITKLNMPDRIPAHNF
jgi:hypothetical protein